jgi:AAA domain
MPFDDPACFRLDNIPVRPIHWLWRPYLACGKLALLDGDPGAGKSLLTADLAARVLRPDAGAGQAAPRRGRPACAEGRPGLLAMAGSVSVCRVRAVPSSTQGVYEVCHAFAASLPRLLAVGAAAKACRPRGDSCFRGIGKGYRLRTGPRKHGTPGARTVKLCGSGPIRPCRTAPDDADEGKADRPPSRAVSALRPWPAANPKRGRNEPRP